MLCGNLLRISLHGAGAKVTPSMCRYNDFDRGFVRARPAQFRDPLQHHAAGELPNAAVCPLRPRSH